MPGLPSLKLIAIAIAAVFALGVPAVAGWKLGGASVKEDAQKDTERQVKSVTDTYTQLLMKQVQLTDHYQQLADGQYAALMVKLGNIKIVNTTVTNNITKERADNPAFYEQQIPPGGLKAWDDARNLFR